MQPNCYQNLARDLAHMEARHLSEVSWAMAAIDRERVQREKENGTWYVNHWKPLEKGSKLWKVVELCKANPNASRKVLLKMIVDAGIVSSMVAAYAFYQNAKVYVEMAKVS